MIKRLLSILSLGAALVTTVAAQPLSDSLPTPEPTVRAWFSPDSAAIGDVVDLVIEVDKGARDEVAFPDFDFNEQNVDVELVGDPRYDTIAMEGDRMTLRRSYALRSFDAGIFDMGQMSVLKVNLITVDTLYAPDDLKLQVTSFQIDSTSHSVFDYKPVQDMPFKIEEVTGYVAWSVVGLVILILIIYGVLRLMAHFGRPVMGMFQAPPPLPPHVEAFKELDRLYDEKLWQAGEYKGYYSRLTDILRNYIMRRYGVAAVSMSTDEIIAAMRELSLPTRCEMDMQAILRDADLVKFAKAEISASDNEAYFGAARDFVEQTRERTDEELKQMKEEAKQ